MSRRVGTRMPIQRYRWVGFWISRDPQTQWWELWRWPWRRGKVK